MRSLTDTVERAIEQHLRVVPDQPLLSMLGRAPETDDLANMLKQIFQRLDRLEAPNLRGGGRGGNRGSGSDGGGRGRSNTYIRHCFILSKSEKDVLNIDFGNIVAEMVS